MTAAVSDCRTFLPHSWTVATTRAGGECVSSTATNERSPDSATGVHDAAAERSDASRTPHDGGTGKKLLAAQQEQLRLVVAAITRPGDDSLGAECSTVPERLYNERSCGVNKYLLCGTESVSEAVSIMLGGGARERGVRAALAMSERDWRTQSACPLPEAIMHPEEIAPSQCMHALPSFIRFLHDTPALAAIVYRRPAAESQVQFFQPIV